MGRLAGPQTKGQVLRAWKRQASERRLELDLWAKLPTKQIVRPPGMRRRMALLRVMDEHYTEKPFFVGKKGRPPLTPDMRWLVARGYLQLDRQRDSRGRGWNVLRPTERGRQVLQQSHDRPDDQWWVWAALVHCVLE